jgi:hypothetical protein
MAIKKRSGNRIFTACACLILLNGCTWLKTWNGGRSDETLTSPPQTKVMETADATWMEPTDKSKAVVHMVPETSDGNKDAMKRLANLEQTVGQLQNDMNTMMPVLSRLVAVQTDIQAMLAKLQVANGTAGSASATAVPGAALPPAPSVTQEPVPLTGPAASAPPAAMTPAPPPVAPAPPPQAAVQPPAVRIAGLRIGEHPGKTRIVLDVPDKLAFTKDIDNTEHILTIDVAGAGWAGDTAAHATPKSPLVTSWQASPDGQGGTRFVIPLRKSAKVLAAQIVSATGQPPKIVIDLAAL